MEKRCALVVVCLCLLAGLGVNFAVTLEEDYVARTPGWLPTATFGQVTIQKQHEKWHNNEALFNSTVKGKEFLEFHREFLAQSDDFRIYGSDTETASDPDPVVIPILARNGDPGPFPPLPPSWVKFGRDGSPCSRPDNHRIDDGSHGQCNKNNAFWTPRDGNLKLGTLTFHQYSANDLGSNILPFHTNGHGAIARHGPADMLAPATSTKDPAFYQWHRTIDNIYADWAIGQFRLLSTPFTNFGGMPILFSVSSNSVGIAGSALNARSSGDVYQGSTTFPTPANEYGASPRIGSDIYVGSNKSAVNGYSNLLYSAGTRVWAPPTTPPDTRAWDIDAWSILNSSPNSWYFSVTKDSPGAAGTAVDIATDGLKGGDLFESCADNKNKVLAPHDGLGLAAADELDALEFDRERRVQGSNDGSSQQIDDRPRQWFSLSSGTSYSVQALVAATGGVRAVAGSDILRFNEDGKLVIEIRGVEDLGLAAGDDLDALALVDVDRLNTLNAGDLVYYSVAPGSAAGAPADILCKVIGGVGGGWGGCPGVPAAALGLDADGIGLDDDLDALDVRWDTCPLTGGLPVLPMSSPTGPPPTFHGACCGFSPSQACADDKSQSECETAGGTFAGVDSVCATSLCPSAPGACCATNGNCVVVTDQACYSSAGTFRGPGTTCPPVPACPVAPSNDECVNAIAIPYNFVSGFQPPADNTTATIPHYSLPQDPPYSCNDHNVFADARGYGTLWYSYTVPPGSGSAPGPGIEMPTNGRSIYVTTDKAALHYPGGGGAGDTRLALFYAPNGNCSALTEVACADNIPGTTPLAQYAPLQYNSPYPGKYYLLVSTAFNVDRGNTYLTVSDPPPPATAPSGIPAVSGWGLAVLTLVLMGAGAILLRLRGRIAI